MELWRCCSKPWWKHHMDAMHHPAMVLELMPSWAGSFKKALLSSLHGFSSSWAKEAICLLETKSFCSCLLRITFKGINHPEMLPPPSKRRLHLIKFFSGLSSIHIWWRRAKILPCLLYWMLRAFVSSMATCKDFIWWKKQYIIWLTSYVWGLF